MDVIGIRGEKMKIFMRMALAASALLAGCTHTDNQSVVAVSTKLDDYVAKMEGDERRGTIAEYGRSLNAAVSAKTERDLRSAAVIVAAREGCMMGAYGNNGWGHARAIREMLTSTPEDQRRYERYLRVASVIPASQAKPCDY